MIGSYIHIAAIVPIIVVVVVVVHSTFLYICLIGKFYSHFEAAMANDKNVSVPFLFLNDCTGKAFVRIKL